MALSPDVEEVFEISFNSISKLTTENERLRRNLQITETKLEKVSMELKESSETVEDLEDALSSERVKHFAYRRLVEGCAIVLGTVIAAIGLVHLML